jgi:hypothetical protein
MQNSSSKERICKMCYRVEQVALNILNTAEFPAFHDCVLLVLLKKDQEVRAWCQDVETGRDILSPAHQALLPLPLVLPASSVVLLLNGSSV